MLSPAPLSNIRQNYLRLRGVQRALNTTLFRSVSKKGIEESARALEFWERGRGVVLDEEDDVGVLMDFAIYEYRAGGQNAVERYVAGIAVKGADERTVLEAMLEARFTLVEVEAVVPEVGARAVDRIFGESFLLADVGLSETAQPGVVLATRLLPFSTFTMTSGAPLVFDPELAELFIEGLQDIVGTPKMLGMVPPKMRKELARNLIGLALADPEEAKGIWGEKMASGGTGE